MAHYFNECPLCKKISQCRCPGPKTKTTNPCLECVTARYMAEIKKMDPALQIENYEAMLADPKLMPAIKTVIAQQLELAKRQAQELLKAKENLKAYDYH